jgi:uncharacterized protein (DUF4415 family)
VRKLRRSQPNHKSKKSTSNVSEPIPEKTARKTTVSLALDSDIISKLRKDADESKLSLNAKINLVLRKHVDFYKMTEDNKAIILPIQLHQFFLDEIDETKYVRKAQELTKYFLTSLITQQQRPLTFDTLVSFLFEGIAKNAGNISHVSRYVDQKDGKTCLFFRHDYDLKWSRILGAIYTQSIEHFLHYTTSCEYFTNGLEIRILDKDLH